MCWADHWEWDDVRPILQDVVINQIKHKVFSCWWQLRQESRLEEFIREPAEHYFVFRIPGHGLMTDSFNKLFTPSPYPAQNWSPTCFEQKHVNCQDSQWAFCGLWTLCGVSREKKQMSSTMLKWTFNKNLPFITLSKGGGEPVCGLKQKLCRAEMWKLMCGLWVTTYCQRFVFF